MDWTVVVVAALGVAGTAAGIVLGPIITAGQSHRTWLRQRRVDLYSDALVHAEAAERLRWRLIDRYDSGPYDVGGRADPVSADLIGARMHLYGETEVREAWQTFIQTWSGLRSQVEQDYNGAPDVALMPDDPGIRELRQGVEGLVAACRRQTLGRQGSRPAEG